MEGEEEIKKLRDYEIKNGGAKTRRNDKWKFFASLRLCVLFMLVVPLVLLLGE